MILLKRTVEIWNIILAYSWRQPNRNFYISPETSAVPINLTWRNSFLIMHLIIFIHLTALYCRLPSASSAPNKHVEAHPFSIPFQSFHSTSTFLSTKTPVSAENRKAMFQRLPFCFFNSARASSHRKYPKRTGERRDFVYVLLNMSKNLLQQTYFRIYVSPDMYGIIWDMVDKYEWTFNPRALVHDVWSVWLQDQNIIRKPSRFNQSLNDHIWVPSQNWKIKYNI